MRQMMIAIAISGLMAAPASAAEGQRVRVSGEIVDTWCALSGVMYGFGSGHHQCAVWCAVGGIPVSIRTAADEYYMVLRLGEGERNVADPKVVTIQTHEVTVDGELLQRDGVNYLLVDQVADDKGVVNLTHEEHGIVPFGE